MKKSILTSILVMATVFSAFADSPLTETIWWPHYKNNPIIVEASRVGCSYNVMSLICDDSKPLDLRLAAVNALGWNSNGQNNYGLCMNYYFNQIRVRFDIPMEDTIADAYIQYTPETYCVFAYLKAMDNYFDVDYALEIATYAQQLQPNNKNIAMIRALIAAQKMIESESDWCSLYRTVASVAFDNSFTSGISQYMYDEIMKYIIGYSEYCPKNAQSDNILSSTTSIKSMQFVSSGTGFAIDKKGYFATNHHVIEDAGVIAICLHINGEWFSYNGKVIKTDPVNDIAIIKIEDDNFVPFANIPYSFSYNAEDIASEVFTLGYPQVQVMGTDVKYSTGVINSRTGIQGDPTHYQISTHLDRGNSGGPLFNAKGQIIAITDSGLDKAVYGDVNYAIKFLYLKSLIDASGVGIRLPNDKSLLAKSRTEQVKAISPYVALILVAK